MGETADQLRQQVDQKRDDASQKIEQIEQKVMDTAGQVEQKVTETAQQVKDKLDWRQQVEERPLVALGAALIGGMMLGGVLGKDGQHHSGSSQSSSSTSAGSSAGVTGAIRKAAQNSGLDDTIEKFASNMFSSISQRVREMTDESFPGLMDKIQNTGNEKTTESRDQPRVADGPVNSSSFAG